MPRRPTGGEGIAPIIFSLANKQWTLSSL